MTDQTNQDNITKLNCHEAKIFIHNKKNLHRWKPKNVHRNDDNVWNKMQEFYKMCDKVCENLKCIKGKQYESDELYIKIMFLNSLMNRFDDDDKNDYFVRRLYDATEYGIKYLKKYNVESFLDIYIGDNYEVALDCITEGLKGIDLNGPQPIPVFYPCSDERRPFDIKKLKFVDEDTQDEPPPPQCCVIL